MSFLREQDFLGKLEAPPSSDLVRPSELYAGRFPRANASSSSVFIGQVPPGQTFGGHIPGPDRKWEWHTHESDALHYDCSGFLCKCGNQKNCIGSHYCPRPAPGTNGPPPTFHTRTVFGFDDKDEDMSETTPFDMDDVDPVPTSLLPNPYDYYKPKQNKK